jgi:hypothetical protein
MKNFNILSVSLADLESAADTGIASQSVVMSIASDLLYLFRQAQQLAAIPEQPVTDAHVQMVIDSHEKGYAMIVPSKIELVLAKEVQAHRKDAAQLNAAKSTLEYKGYTWNGGQFWKPPLGKPPAYITMVQGKPEPVDGKPYVVWNIAMPAELHRDSQQLVHETATAMAEKLARAQVKYGFDNGWKVAPASASGDDGRHFWSREECLTAFYHHLGKGDPLDCINYLAFMRANGWATQLPPQQEQQPAAEIITAGIGGYGCDALVSGLPIGTKLYMASAPRPFLTSCAAGRDGECNDARCPQLRDGEPQASGRHCPIDHDEEDD